jgi:organic hydroperoxide reductase OsmC/OhrA
MAPSASRYPEPDEEQGSGEMPVDPLNRILYTAEAVTEGGRAGHGRTSDGRLDVQLSVPEDMGGQGGPGANPEQLFAVGYAACFQSALLGVAQGRKLDASDSQIHSRVGIGPRATAASACRWPWTCMRRTFRPRRPRTSWPGRTGVARTPTLPAATSRSPSASTGRPSSGPRPDPPDRGAATAVQRAGGCPPPRCTHSPTPGPRRRPS